MSQYQAKITNEEVNELPLKAFNGEIILLDTTEKAKTVLNYLKQQKIIGFDTETRPAFQKGQKYNVALLQLSTADRAFLFRLNKKGIINIAIEILSDKNIVKAGVAIHDDIKALKQLHNFSSAGFVELQNYVKKFGIEDSGLRKLTANILGLRISKSQRVSNWERSELTRSQIKYAATDDWVGYKFYIKLNEIRND